MNYKLLLFVFGSLCLAACNKIDLTDPKPAAPKDLLAPEGFTFATARSVSLNLQLRSNDDKPLQNVLVNFYAPDDLSTPLLTTLSDAAGRITTSVNLAARIDSIVIDPAYVGLMRNAVAIVRNNAVQATLGGSEGYSGDIVANDPAGRHAATVTTHKEAGQSGTTVLNYLGNYDSNGRPSNLATPDIISADLLSFINTSLPEGKSVKQHHPAYLAANSENSLHIKKTTDVWVTFVHEGTNFKNTLGFYSYQTGKGPKSSADIDTIKVLVPNASYAGSGGAMKSGDKIYLGRFEKNAMIDMVLMQNAWNSTTKKVTAGTKLYFADDNMNDEKATTKRHAALLNDPKTGLFLYGFEDTQRDNGAADDDFNDLVFYFTTSEIDAITSTNVAVIATPVDTDKDGVPDVNDEFPNDATKAYNQYFPSSTGWGTLAFEDNWPYTGDYDLNDLIVSYKYRYVLNSQSQVVEMYGDYFVKAIGAGQKNGFGIQMPFASSKVSSISGQRLTANYVKTNANGTEAGQTNAVFFPFDDPKALFSGASTMINVYGFEDKKASDTVHLKISFASPLSLTELGTAPFNPFIVSGQSRAIEIHLPGNKPTDRADLKLFGTGHDQSSVAGNKFYLSDDNWPWALSFVEAFDYPTEGSTISNAYTEFVPWAKSNGAVDKDWYKIKPGNNNPSLIYKK